MKPERERERKKNSSKSKPNKNRKKHTERFRQCVMARTASKRGSKIDT